MLTMAVTRKYYQINRIYLDLNIFCCFVSLSLFIISIVIPFLKWYLFLFCLLQLHENIICLFVSFKFRRFKLRKNWISFKVQQSRILNKDKIICNCQTLNLESISKDWISLTFWLYLFYFKQWNHSFFPKSNLDIWLLNNYFVRA